MPLIRRRDERVLGARYLSRQGDTGTTWTVAMRDRQRISTFVNGAITSEAVLAGRPGQQVFSDGVNAVVPGFYVGALCPVLPGVSLTATSTSDLYMQWPQNPGNAQYAFMRCDILSQHVPQWGSTDSHGVYGSSVDANSVSKPSWLKGVYWSKLPLDTVYLVVKTAEIVNPATITVFSLSTSSVTKTVTAGTSSGSSSLGTVNGYFKFDADPYTNASSVQVFQLDLATNRVTLRVRGTA